MLVLSPVPRVTVFVQSRVHMSPSEHTNVSRSEVHICTFLCLWYFCNPNKSVCVFVVVFICVYLTAFMASIGVAQTLVIVHCPMLL